MRRGLLDDHGLKDGVFAMEPLFNKYGVDLSIWAHEHSYERLFPTYENKVLNGTADPNDPYLDAPATVHITSGAAGCREGQGQFDRGARGPWSAVRNSNYGYGRLRFENRTHLHWEQIEDQNYTIIDEFWLSKSK
jgi:hypothetical protein